MSTTTSPKAQPRPPTARQRETALLALLLRQAEELRAASGWRTREELREQWDTLGNPRPGDWVWVGATFGINFNRVGRLVLTRQEPWSVAHGQPTPEGENPPVDVWYLERLDGRLVKWTNCQVNRLLALHNEDGPEGAKARSAWVAEARARHGMAPTQGGEE